MIDPMRDFKVAGIGGFNKIERDSLIRYLRPRNPIRSYEHGEFDQYSVFS